MDFDKQIETFINKAEYCLENVFLCKDSRPMWQMHNGCLPCHLAIINDVKKIYPNAAIVIGDLVSKGRIVNQTWKESFKQREPGSNLNSDYHAWIIVDKKNPDSSKVIDITGHKWLQIKGINNLGREKAFNYNRKYEAALTELDDVLDFHSKLILTKLGYSEKPSNAEYQLRTLKWLHNRIAMELGFPPPSVLGTFGQRLINIHSNHPNPAIRKQYAQFAKEVGVRRKPTLRLIADRLCSIVH